MRLKKRIIRVGIAGLGRSGYNIHADWLRQAGDQYRIVAVTSANPQVRAEAAASLACPNYAQVKDLVLDPQVEVVVNALPNVLHASVTLQALKAGKHVVCEKPVATRASEVRRMIDAAAAAGKVLAPFQNLRFAPHFIIMNQVLASGHLGRLVHARIVYGSFQRRWDWQTLQSEGGGTLNATGSHFLDQALVFFGPGTPRVFSRLDRCNTSGDADDFCAVSLWGKDAPLVEVCMSSILAYPQTPYVLSGTCGGLVGSTEELKWRWFDPVQAPQPKLQRGSACNRAYCSETLPWQEETWKLTLDPGMTPTQKTTKSFYDNLYAVLTGRGALVVEPEQVFRQLQIIECVRRQSPLSRFSK